MCMGASYQLPSVRLCLHRSAFKVGWIWMDWDGEESSRLEYARMPRIEIERAEYKLEYDGSEMER